MEYIGSNLRVASFQPEDNRDHNNQILNHMTGFEDLWDHWFD